MTITGVLRGVAVKGGVPAQLAGVEVAGLEYDSRKVAPGFLFWAFAGAKVDGRAFAAQALERGAVAIVSELEPPEGFGGPWLRVDKARDALAIAAKNFYGAPDERLGITGITGTNGKTTTSFLLDSILRADGRTTALIGTIEYHLAGRVLKAPNTTPESLDLFRMFAELEKLGGSNVTMEVSSHALALGRVRGVRFQTGVFTNLTRDHLDFHGTMESYFEAKRLLLSPLEGPPPTSAVLNHDDDWGRLVRPPAGTRVYWYGLNEGAEYRALDVRSGFDGISFRFKAGGAVHEIRSPMVGHINVYNALAAACAALSYGISLDTIARGIAECRSVPGRFERVDVGQPFLVAVDYAHTDDALRNVIAVARGLKPKRVITLFGCGGDRDRTKRPLMGMAAGEASDFVVLTSDNPRSEDPRAIINDALVGLRRFDTPHIVELDRETGIRRALSAAEPGDIVILAGKGHEPYQIVGDKVLDFDDREVARRVLRDLGYGGRG